MNRLYEHYEHPFSPIYDGHSKILILGSFPSVKSRENQFYYGHPQNRFWKVIAGMMKDTVPVTIEDKKKLLHKHHIALWDVLQQCDIIGSDDNSIRNPVANDMSEILQQADITCIAANGRKAYTLYMKYVYQNTGRPCALLPSTSPANAAWTVERLIGEYKKVLLEEA